MNNNELKKKIVEIIINAIWKDAEADYDSTDETEAGSIAEALIAAGIGFDKSHLKTFQTLDTKLRVAEHRAARAERALKLACYDKARTYFPNVPNDEYENRMDKYYREYVEKSEKELAEEKEENNAKNQRE